ncbi:hypothetical protein BMF94_2918 [Rhodotorula taiwanensis]|uniref:EKC/KEOPS complex subunit CGI121 n=1 Tax=Rhodotorula taiwanensis TaxID=741276 RepID=A0A2S5BBF3_9BASI|nr:hypothetical protein BMF94_2918 [Rhodotorula taiwanensis]
MESYPLSYAEATVHLCLFEVSNAAELRSRLVTASQLPDDDRGDEERAAVDFAFIDAKMITSRLHALTAVQQALLARSDGTLKTKTIHSEVLWMLEPGSNISDSLKHFGLSASTRHLLLVHIGSANGGDAAQERSAAEGVWRRMEAIVEGKAISLEQLGRLPDGGTDEKGIRKTYKLNQDAVFKNLPLGTPEALEVLDRLTTSTVALKVAT